MNKSDNLSQQIEKSLKDVVFALPIGLLTSESLKAAHPISVKEIGGDREFFRVPIIELISDKHRHIGFMDFQGNNNSDDLAYLVRHSIQQFTSIQFLNSMPKRLTELSTDEIVAQANTIISESASLCSVPSLVFKGIETRLAWKCELMNSLKETFVIFVTPGFAFHEL